MNRLQWACLVAGVLWVGMHLWHGMLFAEHHAVAGFNIAAMVLAAVASAVAGMPLVTGREDTLRPDVAWALALAGVVTVALVVPFLDRDGVRGYANWPAGGLGPLIAGLVMRRRPGVALALAAAMGYLIVAAVARTGFALSWSISLCVPPVLWWGATIVIRRVFDRAEAASRAYGSAARAATYRIEAAAERQGVAAARRDDLRRHVAPTLIRLQQVEELTDTERDGAGAVAARLRDQLRARAVVTPQVEVWIDEARRRGVDVRLYDDRESPPTGTCATAAALRDLAGATLPLLRDVEATYRVSGDGTVLTLVVAGAAAEVARAVGAFPPELGAEIDGGVAFVWVPLGAAPPGVP